MSILIGDKYQMVTNTDALTNVTTVCNVFDPIELVDLVCQVEETHIDLDQRYPRRLFSMVKHQNLWLQYFDTPIRDLCGNYNLQQIFLAYELPGSHFSYHHSHPDIGHVAIFSLDDWSHSALRVVHDPACDLSYAGTETFAQRNLSPEHYTDFAFRCNEMLVINNRPQSRAWGFTDMIPANSVKRSIWLYLS